MFVPNDKYMKTILKCADAFMPNSWRKNLVVNSTGDMATFLVVCCFATLKVADTCVTAFVALQP